ncbi:MAG: alcohol dehydrogenase catalytic domain-containing protein [Ignavibacteriaceae bacterium]
MKQAIMKTPGKIEFGEVADPKPGKDEVLMRIHRIGVCGSDVHVWHGQHPYTSYPVIQGHEFSATIEALGENVTHFKVGQKVTATPQKVCGACLPCKRGDYHICDKLKVEGFQAPGVAQDLFVTRAEKIVPLPDSFSYEQGAFVEPVSVAVHTVGRVDSLNNENVLVLGAGPIGNLVGQVARAKGGNVLITDISDYRLEIAKKCGLEQTCNVTKQKLSSALEDAFRGAGYSIAFECVGIEATMAETIETIGKGGSIVVVGVFAERPRVDLGLVQDRELKLIGTLMYKYEDYVNAVKLIEEAKVITEPLYSKHFDFNEYNEAYNYIDGERDKIMKVFIDVN